MAIRDKIADKARRHLQPDERVQAAFPGQTHSPGWVLLGVVPFVVLNSYRCVVVTDRRILVFHSGKLFQANPSEIVGELPRATRLGPASGLWHRLDLGEGPLRVHMRFHKEIEQADALLTG